MHRLVREPDNETTLYVGAENWPLPIPLVKKDGAWYFDSGLGRREILYRRIGENELETIDVLHAMVDAENEFYSEVADSTGAHEYARRFNSDRVSATPYIGREARSQMKVLSALFGTGQLQSLRSQAAARLLFPDFNRAGPQAPGGAHKYIVDGKMTGGFAFVAFPAEYRASGVKTFIVNQAAPSMRRTWAP